MSKSPLPPHTLDDLHAAPIQRIGYRSPPVVHQFKKGQSGNPKGRPRKAYAHSEHVQHLPDSNAAIMSQVLNEPLTVMKNGRRVTMSKAEANQRNREKQAFAGSINASRDLDRQLLAEDYRRRQEVENSQVYWREYLNAREQASQYSQRAGRQMTEFWIEPEDITFASHAAPSIKGPLSAEDLPYFDYLGKFLKLLIFEINYDCCYYAKPGDVVRAEIKTIAYLQRSVTSASARASTAYWDDLTQNNIFLNWRSVFRQRQDLWNDVGLPVPRKRWMTPMSARDIKLFERHRDPIYAKLFELQYGKKRVRRMCRK